MLCLRVVRGSRPSAVLRHLILAGVSAGTEFLLLSALGYALLNPSRSDQSTARLLWSLVPAAATAYLCATVSRMPGFGHPTGLIASRYGTYRLPVLAAGSTAIACAAGSVAALLAFLRWGAGLLGGRPSLPLAGTVTLLAFVPLVGAAASAAALWPWRSRPTGGKKPAAREKQGTGETPEEESAAEPKGPAIWLPWGAVVVCAGLVLEMYADRWHQSHRGGTVALPGGMGSFSPLMLAGWSVAAAGFVLAAPGLIHACGRLLSSVRPGALRLIAGRTLQAEAPKIGRPIGIVCVAVSAGLASARMWDGPSEPRPGPLTALGATLILVCSVAAALTAVAAAREARRPVTQTLSRIGTSTTLLRQAALVRSAALLAVLVPLTWVVAELAALPLYV